VSGQTQRCGQCDNCRKIERVKHSCLRASLHGKGGDDVRIVWNDALRDFPCSAPPKYHPDPRSDYDRVHGLSGGAK
jgi:hypothetical protein